MKITEIFDQDLFQQMQTEKMITLREHEGYPLMIANYSDLAQYSNTWNEVTLNCRGLIYNTNTGNILARPWKKFFNLGDAKTPYIGFDDLVEVTDKADGSLGIFFVYSGEIHVSTRGSFHSKQAEWATRHIQQHVPELNIGAMREYTFLGEIITPWNRIICDYGDFSGLVLLGAVEISTGYAIGPNEAAAMLQWPGLTTEVMPYKSINDVLAAPHRDNAEGMVIRAGNKMVKFKYPAYVELHKLISNLSEKSVWSGLEGGKTPEELCKALPDEFHSFVRETSVNLLSAFDSRSLEIMRKYDDYTLLSREFTLIEDRQNPNPRKSFAVMVKDDPDKRYMFALLDAKPISKMIWEELRPKGV